MKNKSLSFLQLFLDFISPKKVAMHAVEHAPISHIESSDAVAKNLHRAKTGTRLIGHDLNVMFPVQFLMYEKSQIPDYG